MRVAICQKPPVLLDLKSTIDRAIQTLIEARGEGAQLVVFPEAYLPGYPLDMAASSRWRHGARQQNSC